MDIRFFLRKKHPGYFSIEQLFIAICDKMKSKLSGDKSCGIDEVPYSFSLFNFFRNIFYVKAKQAAINHITGDIHYAILGCSAKNLNVLTIHDCVLLEKYNKWDIRYWIFRILWYELPMRKADFITVISEKTRTDLANKIGYGGNKIKVVSNFVNEAFVKSPKIFNKTVPDLLFIGSTENKNLDRVLRAVIGLPCTLQIVGKLSASQKIFIRDHAITVNISFDLTLPELVKKYQDCDMVLFPSMYEGFGMLIIEANAVGRPVLTSNIAPMKEVAGDAACLVDPYNVDAIRGGIVKIIQDDLFRETIIQSGYANAALYSLDAVTEAYLDLYKDFLTVRS